MKNIHAVEFGEDLIINGPKGNDAPWIPSPGANGPIPPTNKENVVVIPKEPRKKRIFDISCGEDKNYVFIDINGMEERDIRDVVTHLVNKMKTSSQKDPSVQEELNRIMNKQRNCS